MAASVAQALSDDQQGRVRHQPIRDSASQHRERPGPSTSALAGFLSAGTAPRSLPVACYALIAQHGEQIEGEKR